MKWACLLVCFLAAQVLVAEPMLHPVSGEAGFWVSRADMEAIVLMGKERDLYFDQTISLQLNLDIVEAKLSKQQKAIKWLTYISIGEGVVCVGATLWLLLRP